jgi:ribosome recycling factor
MDIKNEFQNKLSEIFKFFKNEIASIRGSFPTPALVEDIQVEYYGQKLPIKQLGSITVVPPRGIQISVWDANVVASIVKEVSSKLKVNASNDGNVIYVNLPSLTQERKNELLRIVKSKAEEARIKSRTVRDEIKKKLNDMEKSAQITEDEKFELGKEIQKLVDDFNRDIDLEIERKTEEING